MLEAKAGLPDTGGTRTGLFYSPADYIVVPLHSQFVDMPELLRTHEMGHSTGHPNLIETRICAPSGLGRKQGEELTPSSPQPWQECFSIAEHAMHLKRQLSEKLDKGDPGKNPSSF